LLVELGYWRFGGGGKVERRIVLLGTTLASERRIVCVGQGDVGVALLRLAHGLWWSGGDDFRVDG
jgi:hypothetical protein